LWQSTLSADQTSTSEDLDRGFAEFGDDGHNTMPSGSLTNEALLAWQQECYAIDVMTTDAPAASDLEHKQRGVVTRVDRQAGDMAMPLWGTVFYGEHALARKAQWKSQGRTAGKRLLLLSPESEEHQPTFTVMIIDPSVCMAGLVRSSVDASEPANVALDPVSKFERGEFNLVFTRNVSKGNQLLLKYAYL